MNAIPDVDAFLYREADLLDQRDWAAWLDLYLPDCVYWVPAWIDDERMTEDPDREISLIYYDNRAGLEDRVTRITDGLSIASSVLPRTVHAVTNIQALDASGGIDVWANWAVDAYDLRMERASRLFGRYIYRLNRTSQGLRIAFKRIEIMQARLPSVVDIYLI